MRIYANLNQTLLCGSIKMIKLCNWIDRCYATYVKFLFYSLLLFFFYRKGHNACMTNTKVQKLERAGRSRSHLCFSPWEMHYKRIHPVQTNLLSASWTSSYLMRTDIIAHRCCCADELAGLLAALKFNRCHQRCGLQRSRDENARLHAQHSVDPDGRLSRIYRKYTGAKYSSLGFTYYWKVTKQQNAIKCEYVLLTKLRQCWRNPKAPTQNCCLVWSSKTWQRQHFDNQTAGSISLWVKRGGVSTGSQISGAPLRAVQVQPKVVLPSLCLQLVQEQIPVTSDTSWVFFRPLSSWAPHFGSPGGAAINVSVLGVGVIYNPLHGRHGAPQARKINNRKLQQAASEGSSMEIRLAAPSRLTIDFIWSTYTSHHAINLQQRFTNACSPTKGPTVSGLPPTSCADLQLLLHWFPYLSQAAALLFKSCHSAAYSKKQRDGGSTLCVTWPINAPHLWFCVPHGDVCVHYLLVNKAVGT